MVGEPAEALRLDPPKDQLGIRLAVCGGMGMADGGPAGSSDINFLLEWRAI